MTGAQPPAMCSWPKTTDCLTQEGPDAEENSPITSLADQGVTVAPASLQSPSNVNQSKDLIRCLPPHLSMYILGLLDQKSLDACAAVSRCWAFLAKEVKREHACRSVIQKKILYLQGLCPRGAVSNYAETVNVTIPQLNEEGDVIRVKRHKGGSKTKEEHNLQAAYHDLKTDTIQLEERNVFCGSYNIRVLMDQSDESRIIHYNGGNLVAIGSADRKVRLLDMSGMKEMLPLLSGHAGSIQALFLHEKKGLVLSASVDLSIRCWNIYSGACVKIFNGHWATVTCLDFHDEQFVSGARDGMVKVWSLESGKCLKTLKHDSTVWVVKMHGRRVVSGCDRGLVKVWCADTGTLIKTLEGHQGPVKCLSFDQWHLVTGSTDGYVLGWSMLGNMKRCLTAFCHPKEVLSLEFLYLRVVSGCADGKIRIFNYLTGTCLKVLTVNSGGGPVSFFCAAGNRMVINLPTSLLMFQFEDASWDCTSDADRETVRKEGQRSGTPSRALLRLQRKKHHDLSRVYRLAPETQDADQLMLSCWIRCQSPKSCGTSQTLCYEPMKSAACQQQQQLCKMEKAFRIQAEQQKKLFIPGPRQPHAFASGKLARAHSARIRADADSRLEHGPSLDVPAHPDRAEATLQHEKKRGSGCPMSLDKLLLRVSMLQNACKSAPVSSSIKHTAEVREAWEHPREHQQHRPEKAQIYKPPLQHKKDQTVQLQHVRLQSDPLTMKRISVPSETKMLQLKLKNSLHGPTVNSSTPAAPVVCPKMCGLQKKAHGGHSKAVPLLEGGVQLTHPFTASSELVKSTHVMIAQMKNEAVSRRKKAFCLYGGDPSPGDGGFRLLTGKQKEACEAATVAQYRAAQTKLLEDQRRACKKVWLRKIKGLPIDSFTEERKIAAPELGPNVFI
ncbi:F-box and WD repeat domain containing protein 10B [Falco cherrug]|uniref:F-box and WD repeat domain containing protein 10B n=1 Tax=Falco cherrug TaxID=345164 RepID=UPI000FFB9F56|nr:F-box and WD repeat domain containing protein 10B [Falco cherrug]